MNHAGANANPIPMLNAEQVLNSDLPGGYRSQDNPTREGMTADADGSASMAAQEIMERLRARAVNAIRLSRNQAKPQIVRDVASAYLNIHKDYALYLQAALRNADIRHTLETGEDSAFGEARMPFNLSALIGNVPALWEFEYVHVAGSVGDAMLCVSRYKYKRFLSVRPLAPDDPFSFVRVPIIHKEDSPFHRGFSRRMSLKRELGTDFRSLVGYARKWTKREFLEQFNAPPGEIIKSTDPKGRPYTIRRIIPSIEAWELLARTGYTPEEFWCEVKKPHTVEPHKPQLELPLLKGDNCP